MTESEKAHMAEEQIQKAVESAASDKQAKNVEQDGLVSAYFDWLRTMLNERSDGAGLNREEHQARFESLLVEHTHIAEGLESILRTEMQLALRYDALRLAAASQSRVEILPVLEDLLAPAYYQPLIRRRMELLRQFWQDPTWASAERPTQRKAALEHGMERVRFQLWLNAPGYGFEEMSLSLRELASLGKTGCYAIEQLLYEALEERYLMDLRSLSLFQEAAGIFVESAYYEGVQVFFDFLAACNPEQADAPIKATVGAVLRAIRRLRPYRYPQWAAPLRRFSQHYRGIGEVGRAAEANMLLILITASSVEEALLLEEDELVDLLRGRRDAAYTEDGLAEVAALCDAVLAAGRLDSRILHIRGWLAARLEGVLQAEEYFLYALEKDPNNAFSHLALAAIYQDRGDEEIARHHLYAACACSETLISCHRRLGGRLEQEGALEEALLLYQRGTQILPAQVSDLELEEWFGCLAGIGRITAALEGAKAGKEALEALRDISLTERFGARFVRRKKVVIELFGKGLRDFYAELVRASQQGGHTGALQQKSQVSPS